MQLTPKTRRVLGFAAGHTLIVNDQTKECFDEADDNPIPIYVCRYISAIDAMNKWKGWLRSRGVGNV